MAKRQSKSNKAVKARKHRKIKDLLNQYGKTIVAYAKQSSLTLAS